MKTLFGTQEWILIVFSKKSSKLSIGTNSGVPTFEGILGLFYFLWNSLDHDSNFKSCCKFHEISTMW